MQNTERTKFNQNYTIKFITTMNPILQLVLLSTLLISISIAQSPVTATSITVDDSSVQTDQSNEPESVIKHQQVKRDYRSVEQPKSIRSVENWISLACLALTVIVLLILLIVVIHLKARQKSNLLYLYA